MLRQFEAGALSPPIDNTGSGAKLDALFGAVGYERRQFGSAAIFTASARGADAECLVVDMRSKGGRMLNYRSGAPEAGVTIPVVLMTDDGCISMTLRGVKACPQQAAARSQQGQDMHDAVSLALAQDAAERIERNYLQKLRALYASLSAREKEVMMHVIAGRMNKQIAFDLGLSEITIKIYRGNAMRKMGAKSLIDFVKKAEQLRSST